ncbi:hypothetical protein HPP92_012313 [Vanilla planifolia]|uniref:Uncharacterized protein n=1 Tax=Vanilla planifolia TaxID=51239 RepID=A0A835R4P3_VANPL|nr:hypothetical protein HPP92_012313 [Vanilla planifolia]
MVISVNLRPNSSVAGAAPSPSPASGLPIPTDLQSPRLSPPPSPMSPPGPAVGTTGSSGGIEPPVEDLRDRPPWSHLFRVFAHRRHENGAGPVKIGVKLRSLGGDGGRQKTPWTMARYKNLGRRRSLGSLAQRGRS